MMHDSDRLRDQIVPTEETDGFDIWCKYIRYPHKPQPLEPAEGTDEHDEWEQDLDDDKSEFGDVYVGEYTSASDWASETLDDSGMMETIPEWARIYFDYEQYAYDASLGGDVIFYRGALGSVHVFSNT